MVCAYLMKHYQKSADECLELCRRCRECCNPIDAFKDQLREFGKKLEETKDYAKGVLKRKIAPGGLTSGPAKKKGAIGPAAPANGHARPQVGPARGPAGPSVGPARGPTVGPSKPAAGPS